MWKGGGWGGETHFTVISRSNSLYRLKPSFPISKLFNVLGRYGITPLPPYLRNSPLNEAQRGRQYQAVFARAPGSVAAPTASLHFTRQLLKRLARKGIEIRYVTLHVNMGTFAPLGVKELEEGRLHKERYTIDKKTARLLKTAKQQGRPIIAVGTTVARTLESASDAKGSLRKLSGLTDLFIREGYRFKFVDGLITNFHVPRSSLLMLVSALTGRKKLFELYRMAMKRKFRLFSFGDAMLLL